jgi:predicted component of type VI protein secretion system
VNVLVSVKSKSDSSAQNVTRPVNGRLLLGRSPDSVVPLDGPGISRDHLAIEVEGSTLYVTDVSSNGTWLNGKRLQNSRRSKATETDALEIPGYEIRIQLVSDAPAAGDITPVLVDGSLPGLTGEAQTASVVTRSAMLKSLTALELLLLFVAVLSFTLLLLYITL